MAAIIGDANIIEGADTATGGSAYVPARDWDFRLGVLPAEIGFSRASNATLVDQTGRITYAPANLFVSSQQFDNAAWVKGNTSVIADAATAPDGTNTADKLVEAATSSTHYLQQNVGTVGLYELLSVYAKPAGRDWVLLQLSTANAAYFNVATGVVGTVTGTGAVATIEPAANGFYRCSLRGLRQTSGYNAIFCCSADNTVSYAGDGTSGIYLWGAQLEPVTYQVSARAYLLTTAAAFQGPRLNYHPVTLECRGILNEEARTNLLLRSSEFDATWSQVGGSITANADTGPDGAPSADLFVEGATTTAYGVDQAVTVTAGVQTLSYFVKYAGRRWIRIAPYGAASPGNCSVWFDILNGVMGVQQANCTGAITPAGNGWYRITWTATTTAGTLTTALRSASGDNLTGNPAGLNGSAYHLWGAQLETGPFATSCIPTGTTTISRSADLPISSGASFSNWFNPVEGAFVVDFETDGFSGSNMIVTASDGTTSNLMQMLLPDANSVRTQYQSGGATSATVTHVAAMVGAVRRLGSAYRTDDFVSVLDGGAPLADPLGPVPVGLDRFNIGNRNGSLIFNGHIRRIRYFSQRLPNAILQAFTKPVTGTGALTEANDNAAGTGRVKVQGTAAIVEGDDVAAGAGETGVHLVTPRGRIAVGGLSRLSNRIAR